MDVGPGSKAQSQSANWAQRGRLKGSSSLAALGQKLVSKFGLTKQKASAQVHPRLNDKNSLCLNEKSLGEAFLILNIIQSSNLEKLGLEESSSLAWAQKM